jgi:prostaglandin-E synthase
MTMTEVLTPRVLWAQRRDCVYVSIEVYDVEAEPTVDITDTQLTYRCTTKDGRTFGVQLEFYAEIKPTESKCSQSGRSPSFILIKQDGEQWWPRLLKAPQKVHYVHTDFSKWVDEEDTSDKARGFEDFGNFDFGNYGGGSDNYDPDAYNGSDDEPAFDGGDHDKEDGEGIEEEEDGEDLKEVDLEAERAKLKASLATEGTATN